MKTGQLTPSPQFTYFILSEEPDGGAGRQREVVRPLPAGVLERDFVQFAVLADATVTF